MDQMNSVKKKEKFDLSSQGNWTEAGNSGEGACLGGNIKS